MRKGFTLVELLIVLAVIAALMAVATPMAFNAVKQAKVSQVAQNLQNIKTAAENYVSTERDLPGSTSVLVSKGYISTIPSNYTLTSSAWNSGTAKIAVTYTGQDVDPSLVVKQYPEAVATNTNKDVCVESTVTKWW